MSQTTHPIVPSFILQQYQAGIYRGDFPAVGLFVDISGFASMTDALMAHGQHGAEVLAELMRAVMDPLIESIFAQGGFVCSSAGDALTAVFPNQGQAQECAMRALAAAEAIRARVAERGVYNTQYQSFHVTVKVGLALGEVQWGIISSPDSRRAVYYFQGSAVDGCAQAEHHARAGDIILPHELLALLDGKVEAAACEPAVAAGAQPEVNDHYRLLRVTGGLPAALPGIPYACRLEDCSAVMARFFPEALINQELSGEFRQVVNLFVSLPSVRTETQLRIFMESLFTLQEKYGGLLQTLDFGDKGTNLLVFWGAPLAYENDIERALNLILDLQALTSIPISAGVTYRVAHAGFIGGRLYQVYTCFGRGVNLAARFMTAAPRGEIWVDEPVATRASRFETEFQEERRFKGFSTPQKVYVLYERKEEERTFYQGAIAGREVELAHLRGFVQAALEGQFAGLLVIQGEPGIGKSRLVHELLERLEHEGQVFQQFLAQTDEILRQPLNPFIYWLRRYFGIKDEQGEARGKRSFNRKLDDLISATSERELADELDRTRSFLGALLGLHWPDSLYEQLDAAGRYHNTQIALASLLQAASQQEPVIFFLEDLHYLDSDSYACLSYLLRVLASGASPLAIIATSRDAPSDLPAQTMRLGGLGAENLAALAGEILNAPISQALLDLLAARAEGNPFYAGQILHYMREEGLLVRDSLGRWTFTRARLDALPVNVTALLVARLDHLSTKVKDAVQTASVLGREFEVNLLSDMLGLQTQMVPPEVSIAEREAIWTALNEIRYIFNHTLLREAAYQMQVHARRKALHGLAFAAYEHLYADDLAPHYGALAYHAEQAGLPEQARRYLTLAGGVAFAAYQNQQAIDDYSRALALTPESAPTERCDLLALRAEVYFLLGQRAESERDLAEAEGLLARIQDELLHYRIHSQQSLLALESGQYAAAEAYIREAHELASATGHKEIAAKAMRRRATIAMRQSQFDAAAQAGERALALAREAADSTEEINALSLLGLVAVEQNRLTVARAYLTQALERARAAGNLRLQIGPLNNLGMMFSREGELVLASTYYEESNTVARLTGDRLAQGTALGNLGFIAGQLGDFQKASEAIERSMRTAREIGNAYYETYHLVNLSAFRLALLDVTAAEDYARQALALARKISERSGEAWAQTYLGHSLLTRADLEAACSAYAAALEIRVSLAQPALSAEPAAGLAAAALQRGDSAGAYRHIEPVLAYLEDGGSLDSCDDPLRVYLTGYLVLAHSADSRAALLLETGYRLLQERAGKIPAEETRQKFLNIPHHRQIRELWEQSR